jgi:hypothetical protein
MLTPPLLACVAISRGIVAFFMMVAEPSIIHHEMEGHGEGVEEERRFGGTFSVEEQIADSAL